MIGILICDDDPIFLERMQALVENCFWSMNRKFKLYAFSDARQVSTHVFKHIDIALLDIDFENSDCNGLDIARALRGCRRDSVILFVTDFIEYAPDGYEVQAFRYILKRNLEQDMIPCLRLAVAQLESERDIFRFQISGEILDIPLAEVLYFAVSQHNVTIHLRAAMGIGQQKKYSFYGSLTELEDRLSGRGFLRVHKSYLVNMQRIARFLSKEVVMDDGSVLRVSEKNYAENKKKYLLWKGW